MIPGNRATNVFTDTRVRILAMAVFSMARRAGRPCKLRAGDVAKTMPGGSARWVGMFMITAAGPHRLGDELRRLDPKWGDTDPVYAKSVMAV